MAKSNPRKVSSLEEREKRLQEKLDRIKTQKEIRTLQAKLKRK